MRYAFYLETNVVHDATIRRNIEEYLIGTINWNTLCIRCMGSNADNPDIGINIATEQLAELVKGRLFIEPANKSTADKSEKQI